MGRPRGIVKTGAGAIELKERKARAIQLRKEGLSLRQIADEMGLSNPTIYYYIQDISSELDRLALEDYSLWRGKQLERLELYADVIHETLANPIGDNEDEKQARRLIAIEKGLKVMERTSRLLGLDMPTKIEQTGNSVTFVMDMSGIDDPNNS